jgi:hypothetical protein
MPNEAGDIHQLTSARVGVLALQGAFDAHRRRLLGLGIEPRLVRTPHDLDEVDALVFPGGESTTMSHLLTSSGLFDPLKSRLADDMAVFGTCAGMILCATLCARYSKAWRERRWFRFGINGLQDIFQECRRLQFCAEICRRRELRS